MNDSAFNQHTAKAFSDKLLLFADKSFSGIVKIFNKTMKSYLESEGGDEDAALKNTKYAKALERAVKA